jgi:hypothetical protein
MNRFEKWLAGLSVDQRIDYASSKLDHIEQNLRVSIFLYENNKIFVFDDEFDNRVPTSYARHTFHIVRQTLVKSHFLQVCKLWDKADVNRDSLPTVAALIHDDAVLARQEQRQIERNTNRHSHFSGPSDAVAWMIEESEKRSIEVAAERRQKLILAIQETEQMASDSLLEIVRNYRDRYIAHSLSTKPLGPDQPFYGDSAKLMDATKPILDKFLRSICYTSCPWEENHELARRYARSLWTNCQFNVVE